MKLADMSVSLVDYMGSDLSVVNAARVSFAKESDFEYDYGHDGRVNERLSEKDAKLISYLARHNHWTPFAHTSLTFRIKAPIFVARQLVKHQVGLVWNEVSRRYVDDEPEFWFPKEWRGRPVNAKQGSDGIVQLQRSEHVDDIDFNCPEDVADICLQLYFTLLDKGVAPEQARMVLPQNTMTEWWWTGSVAAFARVCKQRLDPHAQLETQMAVAPINEIIPEHFPVSWKALMVD